MMLVSLAGAFLAVALLAGLAAYVVVERQVPWRRRLFETAAGPSALVAPVSVGPLADRPTAAVERIVSFLPKSPAEMGRLRRRMVRAGYHSTAAAVVFSVSELVMPVVLAGITIYFVGYPSGLLFGAIAGIVGFLLPGVVLGRLIENRSKAITNGLPDVLDLLIVCLEAGCSLDQAIVKATEELAITYPALSEELKMLTTETRAGKPRIEAFKNLEGRTKNEDIRSLVAMLVQCDRFGVAVSQALRTFAEVSRTKRRQRAEEKAAKVGVKLVFPLVLCLFPALYVVTLGPAVIRIVRIMFEEMMR